MPNRSIVLCLIILTMNGCQSTQESAEVQNNMPRERGDAVASAKNSAIYSLSDYPSETLILNRAATKFDAERSLEGLELLQDLNPEILPAPLKDQYQRLSAQGYNQLGEPLRALELIQLIANPTKLDRNFIVQLCNDLSNYSCSAHNLIRNQQEYAELSITIQNDIWSALLLADSPDQIFASASESAWWSLRNDIFNAGSVDQAKLVLRRWLDLNPNHSAAQQLPTMLKNLTTYAPPKIALLLPLSGRLSGAGEAVRDGFLGGYFVDSPLHSIPTISDQTFVSALTAARKMPSDYLGRALRVGEQPSATRSLAIFDSASAPLDELVARAKASGADLIIGPLRKDRAMTVAALARQVNIPTLLLNYIEPTSAVLAGGNSSGSSVYQLATAIENEAATLARSLMDSNHKRVLVVHSGQNWSQRALLEFQAQWPFVISVARFDEIKEVTSAIGGTMGVADSVARKSELSQLFDQEIQFLPRAREDLDAVIAFTSNVESRALVPALRFHFADKLPIYATSQSIRGEGNNKQLAGFTVTELPILANPNSKMDSLVHTYALKDSPLVELYALGYDAYQLATWIHMLDRNNLNERTGSQQPWRLSMATGVLQLRPDGRFKRTLELANIDRRGRLRVVTKSL
jgi:outer membrane PBP1 activator LpoA protein